MGQGWVWLKEGCSFIKREFFLKGVGLFYKTDEKVAQCSHSYLPPKPKFEHRCYVVVCYVLTQLTHCAVWVCVHIGVLPNQTTQHLWNWGRSQMDSHVSNMRLGRVWWQQVHCNNLLITLKVSSSDGFNVGGGGWYRLMNFESKALGLKSHKSHCV